jgi:4-hydroxy-tetrahydrodipicolinate synthase
MMDRTSLNGFVPAVVTPFGADGGIEPEAFLRIIDHMVGIGAGAICIAGDNGESWALGAAERGRLVRLAVDRLGGRVPVLAGCSAPTLHAAIDYARAAEENGAAALLSMPPTYVLKGSRDEIVRRFEQLGRACRLPIVAYNSPRRAGFGLGLEDIQAILDAAPVIGIKESSRDFFHHTHLIERFRDRLAVMVGPAHYIMPGLGLGASGFIATGPELLGPDAGRLVALSRAAPSAESARLHYRLTVLYEMLMATGTWPAALKAALTLIGLPAGIPRDPVSPATPQDMDRIRSVLDALGIARVS